MNTFRVPAITSMASMASMASIASLAALCAPTFAHADSSRPGKYDYSVKVTAMGFSMPAIAFSHCVTQKDIDEGRAYVNKEGQESCKYSDLKREGDTISFKTVCTQPPMTGEATGTVGAESFSIEMRTVVTGPMRIEQRSVVNARRVGDC